MGKWSHYKKTYSIKWESDPDLKFWISPYETDPSKALCKYCNKAIRAHLHHLKGHARSRRHRIRCPGYEESITPCTMPEDSFDHASKTEISKGEVSGVQSIVNTSPDVQHPTSTASMIQTAWDLLTINTPSVHSPSPQLHQSDPTLQQFTVDGNLHLPFSSSATTTHSWVVVAINPGTSTSQPSVAYSTMMERTFVAIKPEGVQRGLMNKIIKRFEQKGFRLVAMKFMLASEDLLKEHYSSLKDRPFFPALVKYMCSSPVVPMVWEGPNAVKTGREMLGETNPADSRPGTIRWDYALQAGRNVCHCSDSVESAQKEISLWFKPEELIPYTSWAQHWIYEENLSPQRHVAEASSPTEAV